MSLRTRILAWSIVPTTFILLAVALVTVYAYQQVTEDLVLGRNRELTRLSASQVAASLTDYTDLLTAVARNHDIHEGDSVAQRAALNQYANRLVVFDGGVLILDTYGIVETTLPVRLDILGQDWSDRTYFRQMLRVMEPAFSDVVADGPQGTNVIVVAVPITSDDGEFRGAIAGMFRLGATSVSTFYGGIVKLRIADGGGSYIVDANGHAIYDTDPARVGDDLSAQDVVKSVLKRQVGELRTHDAAGRAILASYAPVPGTPWGLVTEESWDSLMRSSEGYRRLLLLLLSLGVIVPAAVATFGVRRVTGQIARLIGAAKEVAGGKFGQVIDVQGGGELEELANQFNVMSAELQASYAQLEQRVANRTRELATLNAITAVVSRSLELDEILHDALDKTLEITNMDAGGAYRLDEESRTLVLVAQRGMSEELAKEAAVLPMVGPVEFITRDEIPDVWRVADYPEGQLRTLLRNAGLRLAVSVPLRAKGKTLGVINLGARTWRRLTPEEISLLAAIGQQIGVAAENARLYEQAEQSAAAAERSRLARDLHDAVSQTLFSASLIAEVLPRLWERNPDEGRRRLEELRQLTRGALAEMRTLLLELRPTALTEVELGDLLRQLAEAITGRARVPVAVDAEGEGPLPPDVQVALYRIAQEALNNVAKHAGASRAEVKLCIQSDQVELCVSDNGCGFDQNQISPEHLGLGIMGERAQAIGATLNVTSELGKGTQISVVWQEGRSKDGGSLRL